MTHSQGDISTKGRGAQGHDQQGSCRSLCHRGKGGGCRAGGRGGSRGNGRLGAGFRGGLGRGFLCSGRLGRGPGAVDLSSKLLDLATSGKPLIYFSTFFCAFLCFSVKKQKK